MISKNKEIINVHLNSNEEIEANLAKHDIATETFNKFVKDEKLELTRFEMYKRGLRMQKQGFPKWFNSFYDMLKNPEYYFGRVPTEEDLK